jgi:hypothetical protein
VIARDAGYDWLIAINALTSFAYAGLVLGVPRVAGVRARGLTVVRDGPYVTLAAIAGVLALCWGMLSAGLPLWITRHTDAPRELAAAIVVLNAVGIAALQTRCIVRSPRRAAWTAIASGGALAVACALFATGRTSLIALGGVVHLTGELLFVAASWGLSFPLMPAGAAGQYQGMFATGEQAAQVAAPVLMTLLVAGWGAPGWFVLAAIFLLATAPAPAVTRRALHFR